MGREAGVFVSAFDGFRTDIEAGLVEMNGFQVSAVNLGCIRETFVSVKNP